MTSGCDDDDGDNDDEEVSEYVGDFGSYNNGEQLMFTMKNKRTQEIIALIIRKIV
jgi:hypothetical protein